MADEHTYREIYRLLLRQLAINAARVRIRDLARFVIQIQREVSSKESDDSLQRLERSLIEAFVSASDDSEFITEDEFVNCMCDVESKAPWDHYDKYLKKIYERHRRGNEGILLDDYAELLEKTFGIRIDSQVIDSMKVRYGLTLDLKSFIALSKNFM
jgi:hypothetical protein